ncbi:MAG: 7-cyano-7-deazaguanine synthase QueC [Defluviitaleaceae bacterium]|nr:7-cyano-7-deazaguanine synthase QueC [Defluviitaleaceae bacterium]
MNQETCIVVFSGGQDSTTCLFWAMKKFKEVIAVTFNYGQRHALEIECATAICKAHGIEHHILDMSLLSQLHPNALTHHALAVEAGGKGALPTTFVPARNLLFMSFAGAVAYNKGAKHLVTGVSEADFSGYPDCRDTFMKAMNVALNLSMDQAFVIHTPLMWKDKADVWALSDQLGKLDEIKEKTLTCYEGIIGDGCGTCLSCELRKKGYEAYMKSVNKS